MNQKIDITSTAIEKGIDIAKDFLDKLIIPAVEETGLLLKEQVTFWKFKNQVKMLNKAKTYCEKNGISPKTISLKLLCPLLDNAALEEDEVLQDKWSILLSNLVDSEQNIENHVFPYILSQISTNEFQFLEKVVISKRNRISKLRDELEYFNANKGEIEKNLIKEISDLDKKIRNPNSTIPQPLSEAVWALMKEKRAKESELHLLKSRIQSLTININRSEVVPEEELREFELSNLSRLGLIKYTQENFVNSQVLQIPNNTKHDFVEVDLDLDVESKIEYILSELGELFIDACTEKKNKKL